MAKLVTIQLLVSEDDQSKITDGLNDALREIVHPMGSGRAEGSFILDYAVPACAHDVSPEVEAAIASQTYQEGAAFPQEKYYVLVVEQDVNIHELGPFRTRAERDSAARVHLKEFGERDGLYWMQVSTTGEVEVGDYRCDELDDQSLARELANRLCTGERLIVRDAAASCFTLKMGAEERVVDLALIEEIQEHCYEDLVIIRDGDAEFVVPGSQARNLFKQEDWINAVVWKETSTGFSDWVSRKVDGLEKAIGTEGRSAGDS